MNRNIQYLGDGLYAECDGFHILLKANSLENPTDIVYLDPNVLQNLFRYIKALGINLDSIDSNEI